MNNARTLAFAIVTLAGAFLAGCGAIALSIRSGAHADGVMIAGFAVGIIGLGSLLVECTESWDRVKTQLDSFKGSSNPKPASKKAEP